MEHLPARRDPGHGLALVLLSALGYAVMPILAKLAYAAGVRLSSLLAWRFLLATALFALLRPRGAARLGLGRRAALWSLGLVFVTNSAAYFAALLDTPATVVALILYTYPVIVTLLAAGAGLDPLTRRGLVAAALAFGGVALTAEVTPGQVRLRGIVLALVAALVYSAYVVLCSRFAANVPSEAVARHVAQTAAVCYAGWALVKSEILLPPRAAAWAPILGMAVFSTVIAPRAFLAGMARIGPARAAVASSAEVVVTVALAVVLLGEHVRPRQWAGGALIIAAVALQSVGPLSRLARRRSDSAATD